MSLRLTISSFQCMEMYIYNQIGMIATGITQNIQNNLQERMRIFLLFFIYSKEIMSLFDLFCLSALTLQDYKKTTA